MEIKTLFIIIFAISLVFAISLIISSKENLSIELSKGKNYVRLNVSELFYVETLVKLNPLIEAVSYKEENETIGYVNIFKGVGKNFVIQDREYEIVAKESTNLILP